MSQLVSAPSAPSTYPFLVRAGDADAGEAALLRPSDAPAFTYGSGEPNHPDIAKAVLTYGGGHQAYWDGTGDMTADDLTGIMDAWERASSPDALVSPGWTISSIAVYLQLKGADGRRVFRRLHRDGSVEPVSPTGALESGAQSINTRWNEAEFDTHHSSWLKGKTLLRILVRDGSPPSLESLFATPVPAPRAPPFRKMFVFMEETSSPTDAGPEPSHELVELFEDNTWVARAAMPKRPPVVLVAKMPMTYRTFLADLQKQPGSQADVRKFLGEQWEHYHHKGTTSESPESETEEEP